MPHPTDTVSHESPPVYPEREDTRLLVRFARAGPGRSVLDLGTGNGRLALEAARSGAITVATDLNPFALRAVRHAARVGRLDVTVVRTDLARGLGRFDRVVANPPYLPTRRRERDPDRWTNLALDGGPDGCRVLRRIVRTLPSHLRPDGAAFVLVSSVQRRSALERIRTAWRARGGVVATVARRRLEGETLEVWRWTRAVRPRAATPRAARRTGRPLPGTGGRRRSRRSSRSASRTAPGRGRTRVPGAASARRRSRPDW